MYYQFEIKTTAGDIADHLSVEMAAEEDYRLFEIAEDPIVVLVSVEVCDKYDNHYELDQHAAVEDMLSALREKFGWLLNTYKWRDACRCLVAHWEMTKMYDLCAAAEADEAEYQADSISEFERMHHG